ncbi:hypothetical protein JMJ77_0013134 [Colletotrichum scovillei]|uniref:Uncharacterized protein n=1 Tax=Colletotrichum scovillei TaxID=1209932 RepID=A0A9P7R546_9PEZI|nr:hypothetical protein JMJ77_0013134 [Colletotrichum scovillei]KAG7069424.1 hypothetical protein JMJ76_0003096 [Colletotrichum scovillei]KAG7073340.1 hypothetical protein JMJ78_0014319 [Colletotrichum scovillei]
MNAAAEATAVKAQVNLGVAPSR